ncbi:MAG: 50S ribosomal protein L27 [Patescibacteria group bacterium]
MAHTKAKGAARINRDSVSKRLGIKKFGGESVIVGNIIVRQKGAKVRPGEGVGRGKDFTLFSLREGAVTFYKKEGKQYVRVG